MIQRGGYKLIHFFEDNSYELYHIADDPSETTELSSTHPEKAKALFEELQNWQKNVDAVIPDVKNDAFNPTARIKA